MAHSEGNNVRLVRRLEMCCGGFSCEDCVAMKVADSASKGLVGESSRRDKSLGPIKAD